MVVVIFVVSVLVYNAMRALQKAFVFLKPCVGYAKNLIPKFSKKKTLSQYCIIVNAIHLNVVYMRAFIHCPSSCNLEEWDTFRGFEAITKSLLLIKLK